LNDIEIAQKSTLVPEFDRLLRKLTDQQKEFWQEIVKPKASRRIALGKEYLANVQELLAVLEKVSGVLAGDVNHQDATIDQLLMIKQTAWLLRNTAGEGSLLISTGLAAGSFSPEVFQKYTKYLGGADTAWNAVQLAAAGMQLPPAITTAMAEAQTAYFDPPYLGLR